MTRRVLNQYCAALVKMLHRMYPYICIGVLSIFQFHWLRHLFPAARKICSVYLSNLVEYLRGSRYYFRVVVLKHEMLFLVACSLCGIHNQVITKTSTEKPFYCTLKKLTLYKNIEIRSAFLHTALYLWAGLSYCWVYFVFIVDFIIVPSRLSTWQSVLAEHCLWLTCLHFMCPGASYYCVHFTFLNCVTL